MAFSDASLVFLGALERHNDRKWFEANRASYEADVRGPALALATAVAGPLARLGADVDPARCLAPQHRDRRFRPDAPPYWSHVLLRFPMEGVLPRRMRPAFALRVAHDGAQLTAGLRDPGQELSTRVRRRIVDDAARWRRLKARLPPLHGRSRRSVPPGLPADHTHADDLRRQDILCSTWFTVQEVTTKEFPDRFVQACRRMAPLNRFLAEALEG